MWRTMPLITKISEQKKRANRRNIFLDGSFAFGVNLNVVARFRLREGLELSPEQVVEIEAGGVRHGCFDAAMGELSARLHSPVALHRKLNRRGHGESIFTRVLDPLTRPGY